MVNYNYNYVIVIVIDINLQKPFVIVIVIICDKFTLILRFTPKALYIYTSACHHSILQFPPGITTCDVLSLTVMATKSLVIVIVIVIVIVLER